MRTSPSYTASYRIEVDEKTTSIASIVDAVSSTGAEIKGLDVADSDRGRIIIDLTCDMRDSEHRREVRDAIAALPGVTADSVADQTFMSHIGGKVEIHSKVPLRNRDDLSRAYTPGVARVCTAIHDMPQKAHLLTMKANTVAVVSDGTAVLGLGDIGPEAALPVMEGKAVLFKEFGGVDAWPVVLDTKDTEEIISIVKAIAPAYGGINLEDISAPRCFEIEERLRAELDIPVFHDDQHGTAIVVLSGLINELKVVGKDKEQVKVVVNGPGSAGIAVSKLLLSYGFKNLTLCNREGIMNENSKDLNWAQKEMLEVTNLDRKTGTLKDALVGADIFLGFSGPNMVTAEMVKSMNKDAIIFACANPTPEIFPDEAKKGGARVISTGRSDFPNQINNVLVFPGLFRGAFDVRAKDINEDMKMAAAVAIANLIADDEVSEDNIIPKAFDPRVKDAVSKAVAEAARRTGVARI